MENLVPSSDSKRHVCMIAYSVYRTDSRIRREAETIASASRYAVTVLSLKQAETPRTYMLDGVKVQEVDLEKYQGKDSLLYILSYTRFMLHAFSACNSMLFRGALDVVHVHNMPNALVLSALLPCLWGRKLVLDVHDTMIETYAAKFKGDCSKIVMFALKIEEHVSSKMADKIISVNHVQRDVLVSRGIPAEKISISLNSPDPKYFRVHKNDAVSPDRRDPGAFKLVYHGTLAKRLGIDLIIQAIAALKDRIPALELHIMGRGDDAIAFKDISREMGVEARIKFRDFVPLESLVDVLKGMNLGVVGNRRNVATELMLPVKMMEYVALGIPVVAPRLKAIEYYFSEDMALFYEPDNAGSLGEAIAHAYERPGEMEARAANAKHIYDRYGWEIHKKDLLSLYDNLTGGALK